MASIAFKDPPALFGVAKPPSEQTLRNEDIVMTRIKEEPSDDARMDDIAAAQPVRQQLPEQAVAHCAHDYDNFSKKYLLGNKVQSFVEYPGVSTGWYSGTINCHYKEDNSVGIQLRVDKKMDEKDESVQEWPVEKAADKSRKGKHLYLRFPISEVLRDFSDETSTADELDLVEEKVERKSSVENPSKDHKQDVHQLAAQELTRQLKTMDEKEFLWIFNQRFVNQRLAQGATEANPASDSLEVKTQETEKARKEEGINARVVIKREEEPADKNLSNSLPLTVAHSNYVHFPIGCPVSFMRRKDGEVAAAYMYCELEKTKNSTVGMRIRYDIKLSGGKTLPRVHENDLSFRRNCPVTYKGKPAQVSEVSGDGRDYSVVRADGVIEMEVLQSELKFDRHRFDSLGGCIAKAITVDLTVDQAAPMKLDTEEFHLLDAPEDAAEARTSHGRKFPRPSGIKRPEGEGALKCEGIPEPGSTAVIDASFDAGPTKEELEVNCDAPTKMSNASSSRVPAIKTEVAAQASDGLETNRSSKTSHIFRMSHASLKDGRVAKLKKLATSKKAVSAKSVNAIQKREPSTRTPLTCDVNKGKRKESKTVQKPCGKRDQSKKSPSDHRAKKSSNGSKKEHAQQSGRRSSGTNLSVISHKESGQKQVHQNRDAEQSSCNKRSGEAIPKMAWIIPKKRKPNSTTKGNAATMSKEKRKHG